MPGSYPTARPAPRGRRSRKRRHHGTGVAAAPAEEDRQQVVHVDDAVVRRVGGHSALTPGRQDGGEVLGVHLAVSGRVRAALALVHGAVGVDVGREARRDLAGIRQAVPVAVRRLARQVEVYRSKFRVTMLTRASVHCAYELRIGP